VLNNQEMERQELERFLNLYEPRLIEIKDADRVIFVGDTHGDVEVSKQIVRTYLKERNVLVFLGDYVDRGSFSRRNLDFLLKTKINNPSLIYLLQGNHEGHRVLKLFPADFWQSLDSELYNFYASLVEKLPLMVVAQDIIALHGALPNIKRLEEVEEIKLGDERWKEIVWGDFVEMPGERISSASLSGRPLFGKDWFFQIMERLGKRVLIRSHQPHSPQSMFNDRCLTIFTSSVYLRRKTIAIAHLNKPIMSIKDLEVKEL